MGIIIGSYVVLQGFKPDSRDVSTAISLPCPASLQSALSIPEYVYLAFKFNLDVIKCNYI